MHRTTAMILFDVLLSVGVAIFSGCTAISDGVQPSSIEERLTTTSEMAFDDAAPAPFQEAQSVSRESDSAVTVRLADRSSAQEQLESDVANNQDNSDRDYLVETATPGETMIRQGPALAIGRLHPEFTRRLAGAIREARGVGLASAGIFSAYRPPAFGVGGFSDKFNSLHTYGLAVDMTGIGGPGSQEARLWHEIAARHGVVCPYGFVNRVEWNHCQPTSIRVILPENPLRETVTSDGPVSLQNMFEAGTSFIEKAASPGDVTLSDAPDDERFNEHTTPVNRVRWTRELVKLDHLLKAETQILARSGPPAWCSHLHRPRKEACGTRI